MTIPIHTGHGDAGTVGIAGIHGIPLATIAGTVRTADGAGVVMETFTIISTPSTITAMVVLEAYIPIITARQAGVAVIPTTQ